MALLIPLLLGVAGGGIIGGAVSSWFAGDSKKDVTAGATIHPFAQYQPTITMPSYQWSRQVQIGSPYATQDTTQISKKETIGATGDLPVTTTAVADEGGLDWVTIAVIGAIGLVGYGLVSKKGD